MEQSLTGGITLTSRVSVAPRASIATRALPKRSQKKFKVNLSVPTYELQSTTTKEGGTVLKEYR